MIFNKNFILLFLAIALLAGNSCQHKSAECDPKIDIPNSFSPDGDGNNDQLVGKFECVETWEISIYNRWGTKMHEAKNTEMLWDGVRQSTDSLAMPGNYTYRLTGKDGDGDPFEKQDIITMVH